MVSLRKMFGFGNSDNGVQQLEDHTSGAGKPPSNFPLAAKGGGYCRTNTYLDMNDPIWLEAFQMSDTHGRWKIIKVKEQASLTKANSKTQNRVVEKTNASMWEMFKEMAAFEIMRKTIQPYEDAGEEDDETNNQSSNYYRKFALYEGVIIDQEGEPHFSLDGKVPDGGHYDLDEILELERIRNLPLLQKRLLKENYLRDVFLPEATNTNFAEVIKTLKTRGRLDDLVMSLEAAKGCLEEFTKYFEQDFREQSVDKWLSTVQDRHYKKLMPEKFHKYNLSAKTIFESESFSRLQKKGSAAIKEFAADLSELADTEAQDIKASFHQSVDKARAVVKTLSEDLESQSIEKLESQSIEKKVDTDSLTKFITAMEFSFLIFYAKGQIQFVRHLKGNVDEHVEKLNDVLDEAEDKFRELGAPEEEVARVRSSVLDSTTPEIQPFINEKIEELKADIDRLNGTDRSQAKQLEFGFKYDKSKAEQQTLTSLEVDQLLEEVRAEQAGKLEKAFDLSNLEKLK